jgi:hypothetical protein
VLLFRESSANNSGGLAMCAKLSDFGEPFFFFFLNSRPSCLLDACIVFKGTKIVSDL